MRIVLCDFCNSKIAQTSECFGFKQWQLLSTGNPFSSDRSYVCDVILEGGQTATKCDKRGWGQFEAKIVRRH